MPSHGLLRLDADLRERLLGFCFQRGFLRASRSGDLLPGGAFLGAMVLLLAPHRPLGSLGCGQPQCKPWGDSSAPFQE